MPPVHAGRGGPVSGEADKLVGGWVWCVWGGGCVARRPRRTSEKLTNWWVGGSVFAWVCGWGVQDVQEGAVTPSRAQTHNTHIHVTLPLLAVLAPSSTRGSRPSWLHPMWTTRWTPTSGATRRAPRGRMRGQSASSHESSGVLSCCQPRRRAARAVGPFTNTHHANNNPMPLQVRLEPSAKVAGLSYYDIQVGGAQARGQDGQGPCPPQCMDRGGIAAHGSRARATAISTSSSSPLRTRSTRTSSAARRS